MMFTDSQGRVVEARVIYKGQRTIFLQENFGNPLALIELANGFKEQGVTVMGIGPDYQTNLSDDDRNTLADYNRSLGWGM